ncbi:MAG: HlyD family efflux transporter periplasmic adaptor subunit [Archangiaceae bacterium]|nr:HlyD family efflux transporter periplasmic adaptor subunit [Archangiaceae bacterium]
MSHHLSPHDVVPALRDDLEPLPAPTGTGAEVITVAPMEGYGAMRMHGFEFSIARMLDGRRTAQDVLVNCKRLGLPVNLDALEDFVAQLRTHGLLGKKPLGTRPLNWSGAVRDLYRDAIKHAREGHFDQSRKCLDAMEELAPQTAEAAQLREWLDRHPDPQSAGSMFGETFQRTLDSWSLERPPHWAAEVRDTMRRSLWPALGVLAAIAALVTYALLPRAQWVSALAQLEPGTTVAVTAPPDAAEVDEVLVQEGQRVDVGTPLFSYGVAEARGERDGLRQKLEALRAPLRAEVGTTAEGQPLAAAFEQAQAEYERAQSTLSAVQQTETEPATPSARLKGAEQRLARARVELDAARDALDARISADADGADGLQRLGEQLKALDQQIAANTVKAPSVGVVTHLEPHAAAGEPVLTLVDSERMKLQAPVQPKSADRVQPGMPIAIRIGEDRVHTTVEGIDHGVLTADVPNPDGDLKSGPVTVQIQLPPRNHQR